MRHFRLFTLLVILATGLALLSCTDDPRVSGPSAFVIGQRVNVTLTNGADLKADEFTLTDASGRVFTPANSYLEYEYVEKNHFAFRIPPGIADGTAKLSIGSKEGAYKLDITVRRGLAYSDGTGTLTMVGINDLTNTLKTGTIGEGQQIIRVVDDYSSILVLSPSSGRIDWLTVDSKDNATFAMKVPSLEIQTSTAGVNAAPRDVVVLPDRLILATDKGVGTMDIQIYGSGTSVSFDRWIHDGLNFTAIADSDPDADTGIISYAAVGADSLNQSTLIWFTSEIFTTVTQTINETVLSANSKQVSDVAISGDGQFAAAVIPDEGRLYLVEIGRTNPTPVPTSFSEECTSPSEVAFVSNSERIAVLCTGSGKVVLFNVTGTTATQFKTLEVGDVDNNPLSMFHAASGTVYVSVQHGGIYTFDPSSSNPSVSMLPGSEVIDTASFIVQP